MAIPSTTADCTGMPVIAIDVWEHAFFGIDFNPTQDKLRGAIVVAITVDPSNPSGNTVYFRGRVSGTPTATGQASAGSTW